MKKEEVLENIAEFKEKLADSEYKAEILRRKIYGSTIEDYPIDMQKYCDETEFVLKKLGEEMTILDYIFNKYSDYVKNRGL